MTDFIAQYKERVRKRLSRRDEEPVSQAAEALCYPSFHPETLLRATKSQKTTMFRLVTLTSSEWEAGHGDPANERPGRLQEVTVVPQETASKFWDSVRKLKPMTFQSEDGLGCDGMSVSATYREGEKVTCFETWCPTQASPLGRFVHLIYDLAWPVLNEQWSIARLENLHGYLDRGLPARLLSGEVRTLRIFGGLSSSFEADLRMLFESLPTDEPLIVDLTNFEGMGTLLYPVFVEFAKKHPRIAWAGSPAAKHHLDAMGLDAWTIHDTTEDATQWLNGK
jgi:hypothetical protein